VPRSAIHDCCENSKTSPGSAGLLTGRSAGVHTRAFPQKFSSFRVELCYTPDCPVNAQDDANSLGKPAQSLLELIEADIPRGEWLFYRQRFLSSDDHWAQYQGSIYAAVQSMKIDKCRIEMQTLVVDQFTGIVGKSGTGQQQDKTVYEISFTLTPPIAKTMEVVQARPSQLRRTTHAVCDEKPSCELTWVRFKSAEHKISERISTNDRIDFSGATSTAVFPVSSPDLGSAAIKQLQLLANSDCH
jgi:hypothetical protein